MNESQSNDLISLAQATKLLPKFNGKHPNPSTVWRWCTVGLNGVRLECARVGNRMCTSEAALHRFLYRDVDGPSQESASEPDGASSPDNPKRLDEVSQRLTQEGI